VQHLHRPPRIRHGLKLGKKPFSLAERSGGADGRRHPPQTDGARAMDVRATGGGKSGFTGNAEIGMVPFWLTLMGNKVLPQRCNSNIFLWFQLDVGRRVPRTV
jgi:hypothetical protein